jgi:hypothetical protein
LEVSNLSNVFKVYSDKSQPAGQIEIITEFLTVRMACSLRRGHRQTHETSLATSSALPSMDNRGPPRQDYASCLAAHWGDQYTASIMVIRKNGNGSVSCCAKPWLLNKTGVFRR